MIVSFIIPAFNASQTIIRCLDSIYSLPMKEDEYEVIVIDDCSTDNTTEIVEQYVTQHFNLTLLRQAQNHRQGAARNRGVTIANGEFICFVDSDDTITKGVISALQLGISEHLDMVAMHYVNCDEQGVTYSDAKVLKWQKNEIFTGIELQLNYAYWCSAPWGYLYRTEFLRNTKHPFAEDVLYEDSDFVMTHLYYAHKMSYSPKCAYQVYLNPTSTTHTSSYKHLSDYLFLGIRMFSLHRQIENNLVDYDSSVPYEYVVRFSESVLEGGCYNIYKSCHRLIKLLSSKEVIAFYNRTDNYIDRSELLADNRLRRYYSSRWTRLCLGHRRITIFLSTIIIRAYRLMVIIKQK